MKKSQVHSIPQDAPEPGVRLAVRSAGRLFGNALSLQMEEGPDGRAFFSTGPERERGILTVHGELDEGDVIRVELELVRGPATLAARPAELFRHLAGMNERIRIHEPRPGKNGEIGLWVEMPVRARPLDFSREALVLDQVRRLDDLARNLQENLPRGLPYRDCLMKQYEEFQGVLNPAEPCPENEIPAEWGDWAMETAALVSVALPLALSCPDSLTRDLALSVLAGPVTRAGSSLGVLAVPSLGGKALVELAQKAPGIVAAEAVQISFGTSPYELASETAGMLAATAASGKAVLFTGTLSQLQGVFSGGQGGVSDPLRPVVVHAPPANLESLARHAVRLAGGRGAPLGRKIEAEALEEVLRQARCVDPEDRARVLPHLAQREVARLVSGGGRAPDKEGTFARRLAGLSETLGGLGAAPVNKRSPAVARRYTGRLTHPDLLPFLKENILGQDRALEALVRRLQTEALTRPDHQPLRFAAQGTPGTGKSDSAVRLARWLEVPYVNIDAASMPDYHTAASQLLGSGRGIVMSHKPGTLERVARHHTGAVVEVSDLDHALPRVRAPLGDLFLQMMETGTAQSATGAVFNCANLVLVFTLNLEDGRDETLRRSVGFSRGGPSEREVLQKVVDEIKSMMSSAFLSRVGSPILFQPLARKTLARILERAVLEGLCRAAGQLGGEAPELVPEPGLGENLLTRLSMNSTAFGARALLEMGRDAAAAAWLEHGNEIRGCGNGRIVAALDGRGKLILRPGPETPKKEEKPKDTRKGD